MRLIERIPIFIKLVDFDKLQERWDTDIAGVIRGYIVDPKGEFMKYWLNNYDQRFGQALINMNYLPDTLKIWNDEESWILKDQGIHEREFMLWGNNYDKDMNRLPKTIWKPIKELNTDHIKAILDGNWTNGYYKVLFQNELKLRLRQNKN